MTIKKFNLIILIILSLTTGGCSDKNPQISTASVIVFKDWKEPVQFESKIKKTDKSIKIDLNIKSTSGIIGFEIKNPKGEVVWNGDVEGGQNYSKFKQFEAIQGTWYTNIISKNGEGNFGVKFLREM